MDKFGSNGNSAILLPSLVSKPSSSRVKINYINFEAFEGGGSDKDEIIAKVLLSSVLANFLASAAIYSAYKAHSVSIGVQLVPRCLFLRGHQQQQK